MTKVTTHAWFGMLALLLASVLMIPEAGAFSMWYDEVNFLDNALTLNFGEFYRTERAVYAVHPPLYFVVLNLWSQLAGQADIVFRALSVFWALGAVAITYRTAADVGNNNAIAGLIAAGLLGSMGFLEVYAHTVHNYTFFLLLVVTLFFFYWRAWFGSGKRIYWIGTLLTTLVLLYTHYYSIYILAAVNLHAVWYWRTPRYKSWFMGQVIAAIAYLPWLPVVLRLASGDYDRFGEAAVQDEVALASDLSGIEHIIRFQFYDTPLAYGLLLMIGTVAVIRFPKADTRRVIGWIITLLLVSLIAAMVGNLVLKSLLPRRVLFLMPLSVMLIGYMVSHLPRQWSAAALAGFFVLTWNAPQPDEWPGDLFFRQTVTEIHNSATAEDMAWFYFSGNLEEIPFEYYADQILDIPFMMQRGDPVQLDSLAWARQRIWVVWSGETPLLTPTMQDRGYTITDTRDFGWLQISTIDAPTFSDPIINTPLVFPAPPLPTSFGGTFDLENIQLDYADDTLTIHTTWQATNAPMPNLVIYTHLLHDGELVAQGDRVPFVGDRELPTQYWALNTPYVSTHTIQIAEGGDYTLKIGWYDPVTAQRLPTASTDGLEIAPLNIP